MPGRAAKVKITERQRAALEAIVRRATAAQRTVRRARIVLLAAAGGLHNGAIGAAVGCERHDVALWRRRWAAAEPDLAAIEGDAEPAALAAAVEALLQDLPRAGRECKFTAEQVTLILALACEPPEKSGRAVTHWTPSELADEAQKRGIVESISSRQVGRFLKGGRPQAASQPVLAQRQAGRPRGVPGAGRRGL